MPLVSVVIPAFNPGGYLERSLGSVLAQTFHDFEVVVVDDGSREDVRSTPGMSDPRVYYNRQDSNQGVGIARNVGVVEARGDYVAFLDQDDAWLPEKLEFQVRAIRSHPECCFCYTDFTWHMPDGQSLPGVSGPVTYRGLLSDQMINFCSIMVLRSSYLKNGGCYQLFPLAQDYDLMLRLLMNGAPPAYVDVPLTQYFLHGQNSSANYRASVKHRMLVQQLHRAGAIRAQDLETVRACDAGLRRARELFAYQAFDQARLAYRERNFYRLANELSSSLLARPQFIVPALARRVGKRR